MQHTGSFKTRGAFTNLLTREIPEAGVVAASGGNHGAAVAFAAMKLGKPARIFVPRVSSPVKIERIRGYGAELVVTGERYDDALAASREWAAESGALTVHAYEQVETLLGQGTAGLEIEEQAPQLDTLLVAVGGGGLIGGIAAWYAGRVRIIGVEPEAAPTLARAFEAGRPVDAPAGGIAADSLAPKRVGEMMFRIAQAYIAGDVLVPDEAIRGGAGGALERPAGSGGAGRRGRSRRAAFATLPAGGGRTGGRTGVRRQHDSRGFWPERVHRAAAASPTLPQSFGVVTRPCPSGGFSSSIRKLASCPRTSTEVCPKNQPSSYLFEFRRCPPELGIERYVTPSRSMCSIWCTWPAIT